MHDNNNAVPAGLQSLEKRIAEDLHFIGYPLATWLEPVDNVLDVAIIGAGMAGRAAAFALMRKGILNIRLFDNQEHDHEGPWVTYARMMHLRSPKDLTGPAYHFPSLTFQAWYLAQHSLQEWEDLKKIPNRDWMDYLDWFAQVLRIPIQNATHLTNIDAADGHLALVLTQNGARTHLKAKKVILATGRSGFGGIKLPDCVHKLPEEFWAHTMANIAFEKFQGKRLAVIGVGASGFDAAATALEHGAASVDLLMRRPQLPNVNKFAHTVYPGFSSGFYHLSDEMRLRILHAALNGGAPPPHESLDRIRSYTNFNLHASVHIESCDKQGTAVLLTTNRFSKEYDFIIVANGFRIDGSQQPELESIFNKILLWKDRQGIPEGLIKGYGNFPYLGPHFEFIGKTKESALRLKNIYCYNFAATASHGLLSSDIPGIGYGASRLADGIAIDFFTENGEYYLQDLQEWNVEEFPLPPF